MNIQINNSSDDPIYLQIKNQIKAIILKFCIIGIEVKLDAKNL